MMVLKVKDYGDLDFTLPRIPLSFFSAFKTASAASKQVMSTSVASLLLIYTLGAILSVVVVGASISSAAPAFLWIFLQIQG